MPATSEAGGSAAPARPSGLAGGGASSQEAENAWRAAFQAEPGVTVNYDPVGSGGGREKFITGASLRRLGLLPNDDEAS